MKKLLVLLLTMIMLVMGAVFISCDEVVNFKVSFVVDDAVYSTIDTSGNEVIKMPENPTKEGYTFEGWYWDKDVWNTPFTANSLLDTPLSSDMNVYAKWEHIHTPSDWIEDTPADYGVAGSKHKECTVCKVVLETEVIPALLQGTDIMSEALTVNGETVYVSLSNATETFSFLNNITVADGASYVVARDIGCEQTIASKTVSLNIGDNVYYILVTNGNAQKLYTVTVRRRPMYTVTFNTAGGSSVPSQTIEEGYYLTAPKETTRAGYTFRGWNADLTAPITANKTITAQWTAHTNTPYKVEYYKENVDKNGYDLIDTQNLTGTTDTRANAEQKTFEHFTLNTSKSTLSGYINGNGTLVLKVYYTRNTYTISLNKNNTYGGTVSGGGTYAYGKQVTITTTTNSGYNWLGWFDGNTLVSENATYTFKADKSINLTAKWDYYTVTTGTNMSVAGTYTQYSGTKVSAGTEITLTATPKTGYTFLGWYNGETLVSENATYTFTMGKANVNLTAKWDYFTVTTNTNISVAGTYTSYSNKKVSAGTEITLTATPKTGYTFLGWYNGETLVSENATYTFTMGKANVNLTAKWTPTPYTITYKELHGTTHSNPSEYTIITDNIPLSNPTARAGYTFTGWYNASGQKVTTIEKGSHGDIELTARWQVINYTITYGGITGATNPNTVASYTIETDTIVLANPTKNGYNFEGWTDASGNTVTKIDKGTTGNITLTANWSSYTVTTNTNMSVAGTYTQYSGTKVSAGTEITLIATPKTGYTFLGWYNGENLILNKSEYTFEMPKESLTLTAKFEVAPEMANFNFTSTTTTCNITGLKDKTVTSIVIPDYVTSISQGAFSEASSLTSVTIPDSVTSIGYQAFSGCYSLTSVNITDIAKWCAIEFSGYDSNPLYYAKNLYLNGTLVTNLVIPNGVTSIGDYAFEDCSSLTSVTIGNSVESIGDYAFEDCSSLTSVTIGNGVESIGNFAFYWCHSLTSVNITDIAKWCAIEFGSIASNPLYYAENLYLNGTLVTNLVIPNGVTSIGDRAFQNCSSLTSVTIPNGVTSIGDWAFSGCDSLTSVTIPNRVTSIGDRAFSGCDSLTNITVDENNTAYKSIDGNLYTKDGKTLIQYSIGKTTENFVIPDSVTSIGSFAFSYCSKLTSVTIPNSVISIDSNAFYNCYSLTSVTIGNSVTSIGDSAFEYCFSLTSVTIPSSVTSIGDYAFSGCSSLTSATFMDTTTWKAGDTTLSSSSLANKSTAATYLKSTYYKYTWTKS